MKMIQTDAAPAAIQPAHFSDGAHKCTDKVAAPGESFAALLSAWNRVKPIKATAFKNLRGPSTKVMGQVAGGACRCLRWHCDTD